jgi:hypothetical protein
MKLNHVLVPAGVAGLSLALSLAAGCSSAPPSTAEVRADSAGSVREVQTILTGSFSSQAQAATDPDNYFDIRLHMVPIWPEASDGPWLYVEQATAARPERPYRQRVYRLVALEGGAVRSEVYTLPGDALAFAGAWKDPAKFNTIRPDQLTLREGCAVVLRKQPDGTYTGGTEGTGCASDLRRAAYATSIVVARPDRLETWDRGYDTSNKQVWGAEKGPYVFVRQTN